MKKNIVLADCEKEEILSFVAQLSDNEEKFEIHSYLTSGCHKGVLSGIKRYSNYFYVAWKYFVHRKEYRIIVAWQQFYALIYSFYSSLFRAKKSNTLIVGNFTYKEKKGVFGKVYKGFMKKCINAKYLDYIHVPSNKYADAFCHEFGFPRKNVVVAHFGIDDCYEEYRKYGRPKEYCTKPYALAIGRSNRDYDFLIHSWNNMPMDLVIISDTYTGGNQGKRNIIIKRDISGEKSFPWIAFCEIMIIPIAQANLCSGDTVLLKSMACARNIIVTSPSTLAEMYLNDGINGKLILKTEESLKEAVKYVLSTNGQLGINARNFFLESYSREKLGKNLKKVIKR